MKITRFILVLVAALSLGLAVFAHARANSTVSTSGSSTFKVHDDLASDSNGSEV